MRARSTRLWIYSRQRAFPANAMRLPDKAELEDHIRILNEMAERARRVLEQQTEEPARRQPQL